MNEDTTTNVAPKKKRKRPASDVEPVFIGKTELAHHLQLKCLATIDRWIAENKLPPPFDRPGARHPVWLRKHWKAYTETSEWPKAAWRNAD